MGHSSNKQKLTRLNQINISRSVPKRQDSRDQTYLLLVNAFSKENEASPKKEFPKKGNEMFSASLVEVFDRLSRKRNLMVRIVIMQVLMKYKFASDLIKERILKNFKGYYKIFKA